MDTPTAILAEREFVRALRELDQENILPALACLEKGLSLRDDPHWYSRLGFCVAKERGHVTRGVELCRTSLEQEPGNPIHYYYLGRVYLVAGQKREALEAFREGMGAGGGPEIEAFLQEIGTRKPPVVRWISRDHPINKYLGIILRRLGLR